ncbi:MAG TPA: acyltransferase domain-containing protein [Ramlibacter sp.]
MTAPSPPPRAPVVWMFSGQGAQYFQMGRSLYESHPVFRARLVQLDAIAARYVGESVLSILYDPARSISEPFGDLVASHPALFMVQVALADTLLAEGLPPPDLLLGASLGEFVAAAVAGVAEPEAMLVDLVQQARIFEAHCGGGGMLVVLDALDADGGHPVFGPGIELAGLSFERCFAVAGPRTALLPAVQRLRARDIAHQLLPMDIAFHSSHVDPVAPHIVGAAPRAMRAPRIPVVSCAMAGSAAMPPSFTPQYWWEVIRRPIDFRSAFLGLERRHPGAVYLDLGPSGSQASFARYNLPASEHGRVHAIMTPFGREPERIMAVRESLARTAADWPLAA